MNHTRKISFIHLPFSKNMIIVSCMIFKSKLDNCDDIRKLSHLLQDIYFSKVDNLNFNRIGCPCCKSTGNFRVKGYYRRYIYFKGEAIKIKILRMKCESCGHTHAILFEDFIPYFQMTSFECLRLFLNNFISIDYDDNYLKRLKARFSKFKLFISSIKCSLENIPEINLKSIQEIKKSYLQIHCTFFGINYATP